MRKRSSRVKRQSKVRKGKYEQLYLPLWSPVGKPTITVGYNNTAEGNRRAIVK